jgi:hypothetical protein
MIRNRMVEAKEKGKKIKDEISSLARELNVSRSTVSRVYLNQTWWYVK